MEMLGRIALMKKTFWKQPVFAVAALCGWAGTVWAAAPPEQLALRDLTNRPDHWPEKVTLKADGNFGGTRHAKGGSLPLVDFDGRNVVLGAGAGEQIGVGLEECDLLEAANAMWAKLSPEQRAIDMAAIAGDMSLWPPKVATRGAFRSASGQIIPEGTECDLTEVTPNQVKLVALKPAPTLIQASPSQTDLVTRARERAALEPDKRPSRIAEALRGLAVDANGQPYAGGAFDHGAVFVLYFGASWCPPCRKFSPTLVKFIKENTAANPRMAVAMLNNDKEPAKMLGYMQSEKMPFPAIPLAALQASYMLSSYAGKGIPQLVVTDRNGKVLANTYENNRYVGPDKTLADLKKILAAGTAK